MGRRGREGRDHARRRRGAGRRGGAGRRRSWPPRSPRRRPRAPPARTRSAPSSSAPGCPGAPSTTPSSPPRAPEPPRLCADARRRRPDACITQRTSARQCEGRGDPARSAARAGAGRPPSRRPPASRPSRSRLRRSRSLRTGRPRRASRPSYSSATFRVRPGEVDARDDAALVPHAVLRDRGRQARCGRSAGAAASPGGDSRETVGQVRRPPEPARIRARVPRPRARGSAPRSTTPVAIELIDGHDGVVLGEDAAQPDGGRRRASSTG